MLKRELRTLARLRWARIGVSTSRAREGGRPARATAGCTRGGQKLRKRKFQRLENFKIRGKRTNEGMNEHGAGFVDVGLTGAA